MSPLPVATLDPRAVRLAFDRAAPHYEAHAVLQREIADRLISRFEFIRMVPDSILDLGCGTGFVARRLHRRYPRAQLTGIDLSASMTRLADQSMRPALPFGLGRWRSRTRFVTANAERLPFASGSFDLVVSNLVLQWCTPDRVFDECRRVLRPGGLLMFTCFGPDTLQELRAAWRAVDQGAHVHEFADMHDLGDALVHARFAEPVMDAERLTLTYQTLPELLRDVKRIGAHNAMADRFTGLTGKRRFARFQEAYERFRGPDHRLPASYEVTYGQAWVPVQEKPEGVSTISLDSLHRGPR